MNNSEKQNILELCKEIKESIDWEYDLYSGYQDMVLEIDKLVDKIMDEALKPKML